MRRTSSKNRSLKVQRETVRVLVSSELRSAHGGTVMYSTADQVKCPLLVNISDLPAGGSLSIDPESRCPSPISDRDFVFDPLPFQQTLIRRGGQ